MNCHQGQSHIMFALFISALILKSIFDIFRWYFCQASSGLYPFLMVLISGFMRNLQNWLKLEIIWHWRLLVYYSFGLLVCDVTKVTVVHFTRSDWNKRDMSPTTNNHPLSYFVYAYHVLWSKTLTYTLGIECTCHFSGHFHDYQHRFFWGFFVWVFYT